MVNYVCKASIIFFQVTRFGSCGGFYLLTKSSTSFVRKSFGRKSFAQKSFAQKPFARKSLARKLFARKSFARKSFGRQGKSKEVFFILQATTNHTA